MPVHRLGRLAAAHTVGVNRARIDRSDGPARTAWDPRCVRYGGAAVVAGAAAEPYMQIDSEAIDG